MKKKSLSLTLLYLIFPIVFNILFYILVGSDLNLSVWISYGFIHLAYLFVILSPALFNHTKNPANSRTIVIFFSLLYFMVSFAVSMVFICVNPTSIKAPLFSQIFFLGVYLIFSFVLQFVNLDSAMQPSRHFDESHFISSSATKVKLLMGTTNDKNLEKALKHAFDAINSSPTRTSPHVDSLEMSISNELYALDRAVNLNELDNALNIANRITSLVTERTTQLKTEN